MSKRSKKQVVEKQQKWKEEYDLLKGWVSRYARPVDNGVPLITFGKVRDAIAKKGLTEYYKPDFVEVNEHSGWHFYCLESKLESITKAVDGIAKIEDDVMRYLF